MLYPRLQALNLRIFSLVQGFFLTVSPESIVAVGKHAAEKNKVSGLSVLY